jgi:ribose transport system substrate-binding protein
MRRTAVVLAASALLAVLLSACGSSSSSSSSPATVSAANAATTTGAGAGVAAAQQVVAQAMQRPATISVTSPVGKSVPSGKKLAFISCGIAVCDLQGKIVAKAASLLGWSSSTITTTGTPTSVIAAYQTAVREGVDAIVTTAALRAEIASVLPQVQAKGIPISNCCTTDPVAAPFIYNTSTPAQAAAGGKILAAEVVSDSKGKANTLYVNLPAFTILSSLGSTFASAYKQYCPSCGYASIDVALTQLASAPNLIVSYLRSHPSVDYVALSVASALDNGLPAALSAAGLSNIKIVGQGGGPTDFQYVANGQELALLPFDYYAVDYQMVDALARHFAGVPVQMTAPPEWLMTKANLPSDISSEFPIVTGYQSQFLKLWGKS